MPKFSMYVAERIYRFSAEVEIEADSLEEAMQELANRVEDPGFYWSEGTKQLAVLQLSKDDEVYLHEPFDTRSKWPDELESDGRVWEADSERSYDTNSMPGSIQARIDEKVRNFRLTKIKWDTGDQKVDYLPDELTVSLKADHIEGLDEEEIHQAVIGTGGDSCGWTIQDCQVMEE